MAAPEAATTLGIFNAKTSNFWRCFMHTQNLPAVRQIPFHDDILIAIEQDSKIYVAMKPICEALGLDWRSQRTKIHVDEILSKGVVVTTTPSPGGPQETTFLELKKFHGWLFKISTRRVKNPDTRAKLVRYQEECYDVLYEHFSGKVVDKPALTPKPVADKPPLRIKHTPQPTHAIYQELTGLEMSYGYIVLEYENVRFTFTSPVRPQYLN
ncbi:protein containing Phage P22, antirepressor protein [Candidatus Magnetobacterium bavaricum]|uniref:Protein containing Phage P22, antirepressor protein n=1 Tax=Candidatus Magnetobacterium bavaricum TaxID=29290 RepID=A0A0F3GK73_9BACT|nr:protein containing Phage P22, antirepressor protein [Candidatus Magnetobacterium bavaricum]